MMQSSLAVKNAHGATPHRAPPDSGNTHGCEGTSDFGFRRRDQTVNTRD